MICACWWVNLGAARAGWHGGGNLGAARAGWPVYRMAEELVNLAVGQRFAQGGGNLAVGQGVGQGCSCISILDCCLKESLLLTSIFLSAFRLSEALTISV